MVQFRKGDMFDAQGIIIVTTNSYLRKDGCVVMGRGAALQLAKKHPELPGYFGRLIGKERHLKEYSLIISEDRKFGIFQVKYHFSDDARYDLIERSVLILKSVAELCSNTFNLNFPGIGFGRLEREKVLPLLSCLPDNVVIWERE